MSETAQGHDHICNSVRLDQRERASVRTTEETPNTFSKLDLIHAEPRFITCDNCNQMIHVPPQECSTCRCVYYCGEACQRAHLNEHREICVKVGARAAKERTRQQEAAAASCNGIGSDSEVLECGICLQEVATKLCVVLPACDHRFCFPCLERYKELVPNARCPLCRGHMPESDNLLQELYANAAILTRRANCRPKGSPEQKQDYTDAMRDVEALLEMDGNHRNLKFLKAELLYYLGEFESAIACVEDFVLTKLMHNKKIANYDECASREYILIGKCHMELGSYQEALRVLRSALNLTKHSESSKIREILHAASKCSYEIGDYQEAIVQGELAIGLNRHFDGVYKYVALSHSAMGNWDQAVLTMRRAVAYETPWDEENVKRLREQLSKTEEDKLRREQAVHGRV